MLCRAEGWDIPCETRNRETGMDYRILLVQSSNWLEGGGHLSLLEMTAESLVLGDVMWQASLLSLRFWRS